MCIGRLVTTDKIFLFILCLIPLGRAVWLLPVAINPVEWLTHQSGTWALNFLLITLLITPLRLLFGWAKLLRYRRMLGLYAFFYACVHVLVYFVMDHRLDPFEIAHDVVKHPYVTVGFAAFILLLPLAVTSTNGWIRRLKRNWGRLHRLVYLIAPLVVLHYLWLVKRDISTPLVYAVLTGMLLGVRVWWRWREKWELSARETKAARSI